MKTENNLMKKICTYENAYDAYKKSRKIKKYNKEIIEFENNCEINLINGIKVLQNLSYTPGKYFVFKIWEPKERIIMALPFFDRVIQHMIINIIEPIFEKRFIEHSYACRKNKGVHSASKQLSKWLYALEKINHKKIYCLSGDIHHYFQSVNHRILKNELRRYISDNQLLIILDRIIDHNGIWPDGTGIPVGNLTSQIFANVYLNKLDQYCKHDLHCKYYIRYMDNFLILNENINKLKELKKLIEIFLNDKLKLQINPKSTILCAKNGIDFVGYRHWAGMTLLKKASMRRINKLIKRLKNNEFEYISDFDKKMVSMMGHAIHADVYNYILSKIEEINKIKEKIINSN